MLDPIAKDLVGFSNTDRRKVAGRRNRWIVFNISGFDYSPAILIIAKGDPVYLNPNLLMFFWLNRQFVSPFKIPNRANLF